ncbi:MAG: DUF488 domain-containing protein [Alphaproteobacteria bacterium]|nr:DUF488 domain-containing protein [Alphaproteobacteria bacterium]
MQNMYTIGFSGKKQSGFFEILHVSDITKLLDIRLYRTSCFVPWASSGNLAKDCHNHNIDYAVIPEMFPTGELLKSYKNRAIDWTSYEQIFNNLLADRQVEKLFSPESLNNICFLCSEKSADMCHRRLVAKTLYRYTYNLFVINLIKSP